MNEADFYAQRSEWLVINRPYEKLGETLVKVQPGMFRSYRQAIAFLIFSLGMCAFLIWGGKALLEIIRR